MTSARTVSLWPVLLVLAGAVPPVHADIKVSKPVQEFLGADVLAVLMDPDRVESFRLFGKNQPLEERVAGLVVYERGPALSRKQRRVVARLIASARSYRFNKPRKRCKFVPGVALRFFKGEESATVVLCFSCDEWAFYGKSAEPLYQDFDPVRARLLRLARRLFAKNRELRRLPLRRD